MIIAENCKLWILEFVENRIQQDHSQTLIEFINTYAFLFNNKMVMEFLKKRKTRNAEIDISALCVVIKNGTLLKLRELKSVGYQNNTIGDLIDRIRNIRNSFMHIGEANLDQSDYDDYINEFNDIGQRFEVINGKQINTYKNEIEVIHDNLFDTSKVERIVISYVTYVKTIVEIEMLPLVIECPCYRCRYAHGIYCRCYHCRHTLTGECQCYNCCHPHSKDCKCEYCRTKRTCIIL